MTIEQERAMEARHRALIQEVLRLREGLDAIEEGPAKDAHRARIYRAIANRDWVLAQLQENYQKNGWR